MMLAVELFNRKSIYGKAVVATVQRSRRGRTDGHQHRPGDHVFLCAVVATAAFAGVLVAPLTLTGATMGASLGLKAFAVAIIGGLTSGIGASWSAA